MHLTGNLSNAAWSSTTGGAQADYDNDPTNKATYGKLYNFYAVADPRGLCPTGWHVPSDAEWNELVKFLDPGADTSGGSTQSTIAGGMLKATGTLQAGTGLWETPNIDATNSSGFAGLPGGYRFNGGSYNDIGLYGYWWSSTQESTTNAWLRYLGYNNGNVFRLNYDKRDGVSVRCVRD